MDKRRERRLARLVDLQGKLKRLHETRQAAHLRQAEAASTEAAEIARHFEDDDGLAELFPELYHRRIGAALDRAEKAKMASQVEAEHVATARTRARTAENNRRVLASKLDRDHEEKALLELLQIIDTSKAD
ncbi:hypothetical protein [Nitratireductor basaltis]|uniref:Type III secretion protein n=1 Tax=Nitratireductor basaltis TaxID=472175 RepID=A0A084U881_9HYPH|nr:hypothetical protein [Nitratireductor basaltis]KFB09167.1 hypothetical protein EL18_00182 [Nitratireductor basaltis]